MLSQKQFLICINVNSIGLLLISSLVSDVFVFSASATAFPPALPSLLSLTKGETKASLQ